MNYHWRYNNLNLIKENDFLRVDISPEIEGLEFYAKYFDELYNIFFKKYIDRNICKIKKTNETYIIIYCDAFRFGKNDINKFPRIIFNKFKNGLKFYFNGEDLFYYNNNKYFFMIIKNLSYQNIFTLGRLFLKKYLLSFNPDKKLISFYQDDDKKSNILNNNILNLLLVIIAILFIGVLILFSGIIIGRKIYKKRKKIAYELDEDYTYKNNNKPKNEVLLELPQKN